MSEPVSVPLSPAQVDEFAALSREELAARRTIDLCPVARNYAARAVLLGTYPLAMFDNQNLNIDLEKACITFTPNAVRGEGE